MPERFDWRELDLEEPFEIDMGNRPHLYKHLPNVEGRYIAVGEVDLLDVYLDGQPVYYPADMSKGNAHWLMVGELPGLVIVVPLAPARDGSSRRCRPLGIYAASEEEGRRYMRDR
jgi:hypothetical protein